MKSAVYLVNAARRPERERFLEQPMPHAAAPSARRQHPVMRGGEPGLQPTSLFQLLDNGAHLLAALYRRDECRIRRCDDGEILHPYDGEETTVAADIGVCAIDSEHIAAQDIAAMSVGPACSSDCQEPISFQAKPARTMEIVWDCSMTA